MLSLFFLLPILNTFLAITSLALLVITVIFTYDLIRYNGRLLGPKISPFLWPGVILSSLGGTLISLIYSEIFLFVPCSLCWLQRIALYPQALLSILAWRKRDTVYFPIYGIGLSVLGMLVALYQYVYQMLPADTREAFAPCLVDGSADCADKVIDMFGFVTFPFVSAVAFAFTITLLLYLQKYPTKQTAAAK